MDIFILILESEAWVSEVSINIIIKYSHKDSSNFHVIVGYGGLVTPVVIP